jgi:heme-degrading monooxygenase HmoA
MFVLHVEFKVKPGQDQAMIQTYRQSFAPAIASQNGYRSAELLRSTESDQYLLSIAFETDDLRIQWVNSELHQEVWPKMEKHFAAMSLKKFVSADFF